jgi:hypothetical protein
MSRSILQPDYPALVSRADLIYQEPVEHGREGHPIGNGRMGTMVWTTPDAVRLRINRGDVFAVNGYHKGSKAGPVDYWGGCAQIDLNVGGEAFRNRDGFYQHLSLYEAEEVIEGEGVRVRCFVASDRDVLALEIDDRRPEPQALRVDLSMWRDDVVVNGDHTARYEFEDLPVGAAVVQTFTEAEYYCASAVAVQMVGEGEVEIMRSDRCRSIGVPAGSGKRTILIASAASRDGDTDLLTATVALLDEAARRTYADLRAAHICWWAELWSRTFMRLTSDDGVADFMQCVRTLHLYYMASSSRGSLPAKWNGSLFLTEGDTTYWGSQFWVWTTQISYYALHAADAVELSDPFFDMYVSQLPNAITAGEQRTGARGAYILESGQFDGPIVLPDDVAAEFRDVWLGKKRSMELSPRAATYWSFDGGLRALDTSRFHDREEFPDQAAGRYSWVSHIATSGCKIAKHAWWRYRYTGDRQWLQSHAYPLLRETVEFYRGLATKGEDGIYHLSGLNQFEGGWGSNDGLLDLTAIRGTAPLAIRAAEVLDVDAELRTTWAEFLDNLAPYPMGNDPQSHNVVSPDLWALGHVGAVNHPRNTDRPHEESLFGVFPFEIWTLESDDPETERIVRTLGELNSLRADLVCGQMWGLTSAGRTPIIGSRLGRGEELPALLSAYYATFNQHGGPLPNGFSLFEAASDPSIEPLGCIGMALNEALVQSVSASPGEPEAIRLFPAWPQAWKAVFRLLVRGGFFVSASVEHGRVEFVEIESRLGELCRIRNPWDTPCQLREGDGPWRRLVGELLQFETLPGLRYLLLPEGAQVPSPPEITAEPATGSVSFEFTLPGGTTAGGTLGRP